MQLNCFYKIFGKIKNPSLQFCRFGFICVNVQTDFKREAETVKNKEPQHANCVSRLSTGAGDGI